MVEPWAEVDAVGPDIDIAAGGEIALLPVLMLLLPGFGQASHGRCRQARRLRPEQRRQRLGELAGGHALQVEPGQQLLEVLRAAQVGRQDRRGEPDGLTTFRSTVTHLGPADLDRANAGLDLPLWRMTIAHEPPPAPLVDQTRMGGEEHLDLGLDGLHQHAPGALAQHGQQRIVRDARSWLGQADNGMLLHGVSSG